MVAGITTSIMVPTSRLLPSPSTNVSVVVGQSCVQTAVKLRPDMPAAIWATASGPSKFGRERTKVSNDVSL
eukprot:1990313-Rhodomonas_salina.1